MEVGICKRSEWNAKEGDLDSLEINSKPICSVFERQSSGGALKVRK